MKTHVDSEYMTFTVSRQYDSGEYRYGLLLKVCVFLLMLIGTLGMARNMLALQSTVDWCSAILSGAAAGGVMIFALNNKKGMRWWVLAAPLVLILLCILFSKNILPSAAQIANRILEKMQIRQRKIFLPLSTGTVSALWGQSIMAAAAAILLALCVLFAGGFGWLLLLPVWFAAGRGYLEADLWLALFSLGCVLLTLTAMRRGGEKEGLQTAGLTALLLVLCAAATLLSGLGGRMDTSPMRGAVSAAVHELRYESGKSPMPEGCFAQAERIDYADADMLQVQLSEPASLYLRGMTGEEYDESGWHSLPGESLSGEADRFYWLKENGFSAFTQLSSLAESLEFEEKTVEVSVVS